MSSSFQRSASLKVLSAGGCDTNATTTNKHNPLLSPSHKADPSSMSWGSSVNPTLQLRKMRRWPGLRHLPKITESSVPVGWEARSKGSGKLPPPPQDKDNNTIRAHCLSPQPSKSTPGVFSDQCCWQEGGPGWVRKGGGPLSQLLLSPVPTAAVFFVFVPSFAQTEKKEKSGKLGLQGYWQLPNTISF